MAEYKSAFAPEAQTLGVEAVFGIVPQQGAFSWGDTDVFQRLSATLTADHTDIARRSLARTLTAPLSGDAAPLAAGAAADEAELVAAATEEVRTGHVRPLKELELMDKKLQEADKMLAEAGGFALALASLLKYYGVQQPTVTVSYKDLTVRTDALVGSTGLPSVGNSIASVFKRLLCIRDRTVDHAILDGLSGVLAPGRPTLLLGPPASGKSTLLKLMAGRLHNSSELRVSGELLYNGYTQKEFHIERTAAYVDQHDNHIPALTVMETLEFAHTCQLGSTGSGYDLPGELRKAMEKAKAEGKPPAPIPGGMSEAEVLALLEESYDSGVRTLGAMRSMGISHTAQTPVGDAMLRGVSGGERKRVTTAEMLVGPRRVMLLDEISTGLDSATLYSIADLLCKLCRHMELTVFVSLLQPPPEVYNLFDDVVLMSAGHVTYHGPVAGALPFYQSLGFVCPPRKDVPSFLQEVATASGQQELAGPALREAAAAAAKGKDAVNGAEGGGGGADGGAAYGPSQWVMTPDKVVDAYWATDVGKAMRAQVDTPFDKTKGHPAALVHTRYAMGPLQALAVVVRRQILLVLRDPVLIRGRLMQVIVMGLITGSLFLQLGHEVTDARQYFAVSFQSVMFMAMGAMPAIPVTMATKGVWFKHRAAAFYPPWVHAAAANLAQLPMAAVDSALFSIIIYFMVGFYTAPGYFFMFYLTMFSFSMTCNSLFRTIAYLAPNPVAANAFGGFLLLILILLSGFAIVRTSIPDYWIWAYYVSPFAWALRCAVIPEFTSPAWNEPADNGQGTVGQQALQSFGFFTTRDWYWGGIGYLWGFTLFLVVLSAVAVAFVTGEDPVARVADPAEIEAERKRAEAARREAAEEAAAAAAKAKAGAEGDDKSGSSTAKAEAVAVELTPGGKLPYTPITLVFEDLRYFVPNPNAGVKQPPGAPKPPERLELLKGITGWAEPGTMTALMGGSGAGKTTLMDVVAGRKTIGEITGSITVNGHPKVQASWARCSGYVEQMDIHTPAATVLEALLFSARLRLPGDTPRAAVRAYVDNVLSMVELNEVMFSLVGLPGAASGVGLNVDARKRLTLAVELVANPAVVFMDEPTSGLDARAASIVMRAVRNVAADGRTVMVTIHQPSIEIFEAFDRLLLLQRGGRTTYFGPLGARSKGLVDYLQGAVPGVEPLPEGYNPATWMLEVTGAAKAVRIKAVEGVEWPQVYAQSTLAAANTERARELVTAALAAHPEPLAVSGTYAAGLGAQLWALLSKFRMAYWRTPSYNFVRLAMTIVTALVYGSIYWDEGQVPNPAGVASVQNVMGVLFSSTTFLGMLGMNAVQPLLGFERVVYYREQAAAMYSPWAYGTVLAVVELPYIAAQGVLFTGIFYPMISFIGEAGNFFYYLFMVLLSLTFYISFSSALVYITPSQQMAQVAGAGLNFLFNLFNGFVIPFPFIPDYYKWANRASPTTWVLYGLATDQLGNNQTPFSAPGAPPDFTVAQFLNTYFGYSYDFRFWCLLIVAAYLVAFRFMSILALRYINFLRR